MKTKTTLAFTALAISAALPAYGQLAQGTIINIDFANGNGVATTQGPDGTALDTNWNGKNGTGVTSSLEDSRGNVTGVNTWMSGQSAGAGSGFFAWGPPADALQQDYYYLTTGDTIDLNGTSVGSFTRVTVFTADLGLNGVEQGSTWDLTFIGGGNADNQGLNIMVNDGGSYLTGSAAGANAGTPNIGNFDADNTIRFTSVDAINTAGTGADIEFWVYTEVGGSTVALQGLQLTLVPEPGTYALLAGLAALSFVAIRRRT